MKVDLGTRVASEHTLKSSPSALEQLGALDAGHEAGGKCLAHRAVELCLQTLCRLVPQSGVENLSRELRLTQQPVLEFGHVELKTY